MSVQSFFFFLSKVAQFQCNEVEDHTYLNYCLAPSTQTSLTSLTDN